MKLSCSCEYFEEGIKKLNEHVVIYCPWCGRELERTNDEDR